MNLNLFIDCCFCIDFCLSFVTAYVDNETGIIVVDPRLILKRFGSQTLRARRKCEGRHHGEI